MNRTRIISDASKRHGINPSIVEAIARTESEMSPHAYRFERRYPWLWHIERNEPLYESGYRGEDLPIDFPSVSPCSRITELQGQRTSWGLLQIMGATARELGFDGPYLTELCTPEVGLHWGCQYLARLARRYDSQDDMIAAYNWGSARKDERGQYLNQDYVDRIKGFMA